MAAKRIRWTEDELNSVARDIYRSWKLPSHPGQPIPNLTRRVVTEDAVFSAQRLTVETHRQKDRVTADICMNLTKRVQALVRGDGIPDDSAPKRVRAEKVRFLEAAAALARPVTIDIQIKSLVKSELLNQNSVLLQRIEDLLVAHERSVAARLEAMEQRLMKYWGEPEAPMPLPEPKLEPVVRRFRVLVACLREDQHHLVRDRLATVADQLDVVILGQKDSFSGVKAAYFDHVVILSKFCGHDHQKKVFSIFPRNKVTTRTGAALSCADEIMRVFTASMQPATPQS